MLMRMVMLMRMRMLMLMLMLMLRLRAGGVVCWLVAVSAVLAAAGSRVQAGVEGPLQLELV